MDALLETFKQVNTFIRNYKQAFKILLSDSVEIGWSIYAGWMMDVFQSITSNKAKWKIILGSDGVVSREPSQMLVIWNQNKHYWFNPWKLMMMLNLHSSYFDLLDTHSVTRYNFDI